MVNWDIQQEREAFKQLMENYRERQEEANKAKERGDREEYYVLRDLAFHWQKEARDCYQTIKWLEENNYG